MLVSHLHPVSFNGFKIAMSVLYFWCHKECCEFDEELRLMYTP